MTDKTDAPERLIHKFKFKDVDWAHVALVDKAANLQEVLTLKAEQVGEVQITLTMREFLNKFFHMWDEDAATLAGILGYDSTVRDSYYLEHGSEPTPMEAVQSRIDSVVLLKGMEIPDTAPKSVANDITNLMKSIGDKLTSKDSPSEEPTSKVSKLEITQEEFDSMKADLEASKTALSDNVTMKAQLATLTQQIADNAKTEMEICVKGYSFITDEDQPAIVEALLKSEDKAVILKALEGARDAVTAAADIDGEEGTSGGDADLKPEEDDMTKAADGGLVAKIIAKRDA